MGVGVGSTPARTRSAEVGFRSWTTVYSRSVVTPRDKRAIAEDREVGSRTLRETDDLRPLPRRPCYDWGTGAGCRAGSGAGDKPGRGPGRGGGGGGPGRSPGRERRVSEETDVHAGGPPPPPGRETAGRRDQAGETPLEVRPGVGVTGPRADVAGGGEGPGGTGRLGSRAWPRPRVVVSASSAGGVGGEVGRCRRGECGPENGRSRTGDGARLRRAGG